jgi:DNA-binding MarR family transcriptional regulator
MTDMGAAREHAIQQTRSRDATFAPLPYRAIGDPRMTLTHMRVLAAIAWHDRMSGRRKGQGCWASHKTLAEMCGVNYTNLSTAIRELGEWRYVVKQSHPLNRRQHVYRVIYASGDGLPTGEESADREGADASDAIGQSDPIALEDGPAEHKKSPGSVCPRNSKDKCDQSLTGVEYIPLNGKEITQKRKTNSPEGALRDWAMNDGAVLAKIERSHIASSQPLSQEEVAIVESIIVAYDSKDKIHHWAVRILESFENRE